jgi:hypothetical protein
MVENKEINVYNANMVVFTNSNLYNNKINGNIYEML